ncbi:Predicted arabinose efflux permease, MFS family [Amycolatopsis tolypomycina]|uniref:Predicted arabinose efflux permease, MFS family n=1 Tax=Amycolatopsis tolypomycina TaxID=208445 RepID=A0A1H4XDL9_9PSEU|nr:MFS transporter [Amycolatopsis tolypomycina]SED02998.1 Predicted arabinose efflux permease, MFS family [Amycolatopsis tolypomycina]
MGSSLGGGYWRLWTSAALSNLADGILKFALPLLAIGYTRAPALVAGLTLAFTLPWLLFALPAGAIADRADRRSVMLLANVARATLLTGLLVAVLLDAGSIWLLYVAALGTGIAETCYDTASQAIVPQLVGRDQLPRANGRLYAAETTALELAGPPAAGLLVAAGAALPLGTPIALWAAAVGVLLLVRGPFKVRATGRRPVLRAEIAEGLRFVWRTGILRTFTVMTGVFNFASSAILAVLVLYAVGPDSAMGLSGAAYGWLLSLIAAGCLAGSFFAEPAERALGAARAIGIAFFLGAASLGVPALTADPVIIGAAFFVGGVGLIVSNVTTVSLRQRITPDRLLGRTNSSHRLVAYGTRPLGALVGGVLTESFGLRPVFAAMSLLAMATVFGATKVTAAAVADAERAAVPAIPRP